jgi:ATP-binding cassette, subfamily B, bacterial
MASYRNILSYFRDYKGTALFSIAASSLFEIIDLLVPYAVGQILNVLSRQPVDAPLTQLTQGVAGVLQLPVAQPKLFQALMLGVLLTMIFVVTVIRAPIQPWIGAWFHWDIALRARRDHSQRVLAKILTLPLDFYDENNPGRVAGRVARGIYNHTWSYPEIAGQLIPKLMRVVGIFLILGLIDWRIALAFAGSFLLILWVSFRKLRQLIRREEILDRYMENTESRTSEIITNIKTVKAFATEANELERQRQRLEREFKIVDYRIHIGYVRLGTLQRTMVQLCVFLLLGFTLLETFWGKISLGHFITTLTISNMAYSELDPISQLGEVFARRYAAMLRFHEFMQQPAGRDAASLVLADLAENPYQFTGKLEFAQVRFGYDPNRPVLQDINLQIQPCQTIALVGRSGSGKSTLVKLLFRYFEPSQGKILIDGEDICSLDTGHYRRRLAIVHQEVDVFNGTILDNLVYGNPSATPAQVQSACDIARVSEFVEKLPQGYGTIVGERGLRLSGGQRQRLGIARALIMNPDVLVFDEATSSLDYESEREIQRAMRSIFGTRTTLIIAHRLSTVREADQIVVLDQGTIAEVGTHEQLLDRQGIYHRLHLLQETGELY